MLTESAFQVVGEGDGKRLGILNTSSSARWHGCSGRCSGRRRGTRAADQGPSGGHEGDHQGDPQWHDCVRTVHLKRDFQDVSQRDYLRFLFYDASLQHRLSKVVPNPDREIITQITTAADELAARIPAERFNFDAAKASVMERTSL
jgi:hypothetical protein